MCLSLILVRPFLLRTVRLSSQPWANTGQHFSRMVLPCLGSSQKQAYLVWSFVNCYLHSIFMRFVHVAACTLVNLSKIAKSYCIVGTPTVFLKIRKISVQIVNTSYLSVMIFANIISHLYLAIYFSFLKRLLKSPTSDDLVH